MEKVYLLSESEYEEFVRLQKLEPKFNECQEQLAKAKDWNAELMEFADTLSKKGKKFYSEKETLQKQVSNQKKMIKDLEQKLSDMKNQRDAMLKLAETLQKTISELRH